MTVVWNAKKQSKLFSLNDSFYKSLILIHKNKNVWLTIDLVASTTLFFGEKKFDQNL